MIFGDDFFDDKPGGVAEGYEGHHGKGDEFFFAELFLFRFVGDDNGGECCDNTADELNEADALAAEEERREEEHEDRDEIEHDNDDSCVVAAECFEIVV